MLYVVSLTDSSNITLDNNYSSPEDVEATDLRTLNDAVR